MNTPTKDTTNNLLTDAWRQVITQICQRVLSDLPPAEAELVLRPRVQELSYHLDNAVAHNFERDLDYWIRQFEADLESDAARRRQKVKPV